MADLPANEAAFKLLAGEELSTPEQAEVRTAIGLATVSSQVDESITRLGLDPRVAAHARRQRITSLPALVRINEWIKGIDGLGLTINEAVFLGSDLNGGNPPRSFIRGDLSGTPIGTIISNIHGATVTDGASSRSYDFPIDGLADFTLVTFFSGDDSVEANKGFAALHNSERSVLKTSIQIRTTNTSGSALVYALKTGQVASQAGTFASLASEVSRCYAVKWEDGVGHSASDNGAAFQTQTAYAQTISSDLVWFFVGGHKGTHQGAVVFNELLSNEQIAAVKLLAQRTIFSSNLRLVLEGDSIMEGANEWVEMALRSGQWAGSTHALNNIATGGETAKQVYDQAVAGSFNAYLPSASSPEWWLILQAGTNDYGNFSATGDYTNAKILEHLTETCRIAKEAGCAKTVLCTTLLRTARKADLQANNAAILARTATGMEYVDEVFDADGVMAATAGADYEEDPTYFADVVHPNDTGRQVLADGLNALILTTRAQEATYL